MTTTPTGREERAIELQVKTISLLDYETQKRVEVNAYSRDFLVHAANTGSQYDTTCRKMAEQVLATDAIAVAAIERAEAAEAALERVREDIRVQRAAKESYKLSWLAEQKDAAPLRDVMASARALLDESVGPHDPPRRGSNLERLYLAMRAFDAQSAQPQPTPEQVTSGVGTCAFCQGSWPLGERKPIALIRSPSTGVLICQHCAWRAGELADEHAAKLVQPEHPPAPPAPTEAKPPGEFGPTDERKPGEVGTVEFKLTSARHYLELHQHALTENNVACDLTGSVAWLLRAVAQMQLERGGRERA